MEKGLKTKYYLFDQNNSGGMLKVTKVLDEYVLIEALNAEHANQLAETIGIYFGGVAKDIDCPCCGDRWDAVKDHESYESLPDFFERRCILFQKERYRSKLKIYNLSENGTIHLREK